MNASKSRWRLLAALGACFAGLALSQPDMHPRPGRLPNGKSQSEEILKAEHQQNLKDAAKLVQMAEELKQELEKDDRHVLSVATLKKTDEIEKLARKIGSRLRRH
jgi:hypothetical protein